MRTINLSTLLLISLVSSSFGKYSLPPLEKPIVDPSTGLNVPPGSKSNSFTRSTSKHGSWIAMAFDKQGA